MYEIVRFLCADTNSWKLKVDIKYFNKGQKWMWTLGHRTPKLSISQKCWWGNFREAKSYYNVMVAMVENGCSQSGHEILKLAVS